MVTVEPSFMMVGTADVGTPALHVARSSQLPVAFEEVCATAIVVPVARIATTAMARKAMRESMMYLPSKDVQSAVTAEPRKQAKRLPKNERRELSLTLRQVA